VKAGKKFAVVLVTAPDLKIARKLAQGALRARLIACANIVPKIESHYWWQGELESGAEVLIVFKTTQSKLVSFEKFVVANHPYDTPEFIALPITAGNKRYLAWLAATVT
jgi:periplasmic divalent cation tolerance protein